MTTKRRLQIIENLFWQRAQVHLAAMTAAAVARFDKGQLLAVATFLDSTQGATVDPALARDGGALLGQWRQEMTAEAWQSFWLLPGLAASVDAAIDNLLPPSY